MTSLLPAAVLRLGSGKITIRRVTVQALVSFLRLKPEAVHTFQKAVVNQALTQTDSNALKEVNMLFVRCLHLNSSKLCFV